MLVHIQILHIPIYVVILHILVYVNISAYTDICYYLIYILVYVNISVKILNYNKLVLFEVFVS